MARARAGLAPSGPAAAPAAASPDQVTLTWHFCGSKAKARRRRRENFHSQLDQTCPAYALTICQALRDYKQACAADMIDNDTSWQRVHDSWDWGLLMEEVLSSDDEPAAESAQDPADE